MEVAEEIVEQMSYEDFLAQKDEIKSNLQDALDTIVEEDNFGDDDAPPESLCTGMPVVDSKTVMKLSPDVEEAVGIEIDSKWLKPGGYESSEEAVDSLVESIGKELQERETVEEAND